MKSKNQLKKEIKKMMAEIMKIIEKKQRLDTRKF